MGTQGLTWLSGNSSNSINLFCITRKRAGGINSPRCFSILSIISLLFLLSLIPASIYASSAAGATLFEEIPHAQAPVVSNRSAMRSRNVKVNVSVLLGSEEGAELAKGSQLGSRELTANLFADLSLSLVNSKVYANRSGNVTWIGDIKDSPLGTAIFVVRDNNYLYGFVQSPDKGTFSIKPVDGATHIIEQIDSNSLLVGEDDSVVLEKRTNQNRSLLSRPVEISNDDGSIIDVMVAYDQSVDAQNASDGSVTAADAQAYAELFIAYTNQTYENSGIQQRVWLAGDVAGFDYSDDGVANGTDINAIANGTSIPGLDAKRDEYHADILMFFIPHAGGSCGGFGVVQTVNNNPSWGDDAISVMQACSFGAGIFAHELGHNMGSRHDWFMDNGTTPDSIGHGYVDTNVGLVSIMAYGNRCAELGISCSGIPYFSNPAITYSGVAIGVPSGTSTACAVADAEPSVECDADNVTNFNNKAAITSKFRDSRVSWTGASDTDWFNAANWTINEGTPGATTVVNRVPRSFDNVYIPAGVSNYPSIAGTATARELTIESGASLDMTSGTLTVGWSWEDEGGFNATGGTVIFSGPIGVGITSSSAFNNVQIGTGSDTSEVILESNFDVNGDLQISAGAKLNAANYTINLAGNWQENTPSGFQQGSGTVIFDGSNQSVNKLTYALVLNEDFSEGDGKGCGCSTVYLPAGWTRESAWFGGELSADGDAIASGNGWLHSVPLSLSSSSTYTLTFDFVQYSGTDTLRVYYGSNPNSASMSTSIGTISSTGAASFDFTVPTSGTYYIGFHHDGSDWSYMDNVALAGSAAINFHNIEIASGTATFTENVVVSNNLQINAGGIANFDIHDLSVEGNVANDGTIRQTKSLSNNSTAHFIHIQNAAATTDKYYGLEITPSSGDMGATTVDVRGNQFCSATAPASRGVKRCYVVMPTTSQTSDIKFYYDTAENNGNTDPDVYLESAGTWLQQNTSAHGGTGIAVWAMANLTAYGTLAVSDNIGPDQDSDGIPDYWEELYNLDPQSSADASLDADNDGLTNLQEYQYNANPGEADSDGDGMNDGDEVAIGRDPNDPTDAYAGITILPILMQLIFE